MSKFLASFVFIAALTLGASQVNASIVVWDGPSDGDAPDDFGALTEISFPGFVADELTLITGGGYAHNHGNLGTIFTIDVHLNGVWTTIDSYQIDFDDHLVSERTLGGPIHFASGIVDGLRLTDSPAVGNGYHGMYGSYLADGVTTFEFNNNGNAVPEPSSMILLGLGGIGMGLSAWRRKRLAVA